MSLSSFLQTRLGEKVDEESKAKMENHFANACKYEYLFWEMVYNFPPPQGQKAPT